MVETLMASSVARRSVTGRLVVGVASLALIAGACGSDTTAPAPEATRSAMPGAGAQWPNANLDLAGSRATTSSPIDASTVAGLEVAWTFDVPGAGVAGTLATTPVVVDGVVWVTDLQSNVYGIDLADGREVLSIRHDSSTFGPNGAAVGDGRVFVAPNSQSVAAFDAKSGVELWRNQITDENGGAVNIQPLLVEDKVLVATSTLSRAGSRGTLFALDAETGKAEWMFDTIESPDLWGNPKINSGGGSWYPPAVDVEARRVYWGTSNPYPWPGVADFPNGSSRPGDNRWTNSTLALDLDTGRLEWGRQHRAHDLFDLDTTLTALTTAGPDGRQIVIASGKFGRVVGLDPATGDVLWNTPVGRHENDDLQSFSGEIVVYPGYVGGVTTPLAVADGVVYAAVVNAPSELPAPAIDFRPDSPNFAVDNGQMVAVDASDGRVLWDVDVDGQAFGAATVVNDLVFGSTLTGELFALDRTTGAKRWSAQLDTGINGWPAVAGDTIVVPAGVDLGTGTPKLVAYRLRSGSTTTTR
jgi:outer membrane protein assembly factor BamB